MRWEIVKDTPITQRKSEKEKPKKSDDFRTEKPQWALKDVSLPQRTKEDLGEAIAFKQFRDKLLYEWEFCRFLKTGICVACNLYGPPGTGKTTGAEGLAHELGMNIIKVNYGELESEYMGGTAKNLEKILRHAEATNSVLFFDEADAILSRRLSNLTHAADHSVNLTKNVLLKALDNFDGVIVFATNLFDNYDEAFLRRILFHIEFGLPDESTRLPIWKLHLSKHVPKSITYERAAALSDGLSGGDIRNVMIKVGLRLLAGNVEMLDEQILKDVIAEYQHVKEQHRKVRSHISISPTIQQ